LNTYIDSSVLLRVILGERGRLTSWGRIDVAVSSELIRVECLRTIDRARIQLGLSDETLSRHRADALEAIETLDLIPLAPSVLERAAEPFPTRIGTVDAMHLASAVLVRDRYDSLAFATHDEALGVAARAMGFSVEGIRA
jgi:predicted nucleic acid-binding protein